MGLEDQKEEREVLESIFPDEITGKSTRLTVIAVGHIGASQFQC